MVMALPLSLTQWALVAISAYLSWTLLRWLFAKSSFDHIPGPKQTSPLLTGFAGITTRNGWEFMDDMVDKYGGIVKLRDIFGNKMLYVTDPAALQAIISNHNHVYEEAEGFVNGTRLVFGPSILSAMGHAHRKQRKMLNPVFSQVNLKNVAPILDSVGRTLRIAVESQLKDGPKTIDMLRWCSRGTLEMVGQAMIDYSFDPLLEERRNEYASAITAAFPATFAVSLHFFAALIWTKLFGFNRFGSWLVNMYPNAKVQRAKSLWTTLWSRAERLVNEKIAVAVVNGKAVSTDSEPRGANGRDLLHVLVKANLAAQEDDRLTDEELVAQVNTIIFGAVDTSTSTVSRLLYTLALHSEAQEKLRGEIQAFASSNDEVSFEKLMDLPFLDAVYRETVRVYPPVHVMNRETQDSAVLPVGRPFEGNNGSVVREVVIDKGTTVVIGIHGYNRSKAIWGEDAKEWKPERWLSPLPDSAKNPTGAVLSNIMTFVGGARSCMGYKFAELQIKMTVFHLLQSLKLSLGKQEIVWNTSRVSYPTTSFEISESSMPLHVEIIGSSA